MTSQRCVRDIYKTDSGEAGQSHHVSAPLIKADRQLWFMNTLLAAEAPLVSFHSALGSGLNLGVSSVWVVVIINKDRARVLKACDSSPKRLQPQGSLSNHRSHSRRLIAGCCEKIGRSLWHHRHTMTFPSSLCHCWLAVWLCFDCKTPGFRAERSPVVFQFGA